MVREGRVKSSNILGNQGEQKSSVIAGPILDDCLRDP